MVIAGALHIFSYSHPFSLPKSGTYTARALPEIASSICARKRNFCHELPFTVLLKVIFTLRRYSIFVNGDTPMKQTSLRGISSSRAGRYLIVLLLPVLLFRGASDFFHNHSAQLDCSYSPSSVCSACQLDATFATESYDPAPLPPVPVVQISRIEILEAFPFLSSRLPASGRAPPLKLNSLL